MKKINDEVVMILINNNIIMKMKAMTLIYDDGVWKWMTIEETSSNENKAIICVEMKTVQYNVRVMMKMTVILCCEKAMKGVILLWKMSEIIMKWY